MKIHFKPSIIIRSVVLAHLTPWIAPGEAAARDSVRMEIGKADSGLIRNEIPATASLERNGALVTSAPNDNPIDVTNAWSVTPDCLRKTVAPHGGLATRRALVDESELGKARLSQPDDSPQLVVASQPPAGPPLVYGDENTGAGFAPPPLPAKAVLPVIEPLTDPFMWSDGSGRVTAFDEWSRRRSEIKAEFEHYEIGKKPDRPEKISARYENGMLTVEVTVNGESLTLKSEIALPSGDGPFPALIGIGRSSGSLPADIFKNRDVALITYQFSQVMAHTQKRGQEPFNRLYPGLTDVGAYSAWSWGVSRLIDGLELVEKDLPIDLNHLAISGCSFAGKMALFAGAFDERIALTIAQEPGGGGAAAWRVSETLGKVETLGATSRAWFKEDMFQFSGADVAKLPMDHHELMAMVAPRALLVLGNPDFEWLADESGYVSCRAAHEVWKSFGIGDRFGFSILGGHGHCQLPDRQKPKVEAFVDKFLLGRTAADTSVNDSIYDSVDHSRWIEWWGTDKPVLRPASSK